MARIIGGLGVSHTPTIGFAMDHDNRQVTYSVARRRDTDETPSPDTC
ncbi:hypothetical protein [Chromohalobacter nigrandesensis]|nr:hypothetical protein [Chromohalobacter nigrandesensis]MCK0745176.1 hypothetical protein [Chromohalobacter nigrandesensis]